MRLKFLTPDRSSGATEELHGLAKQICYVDRNREDRVFYRCFLLIAFGRDCPQPDRDDRIIGGLGITKRKLLRRIESLCYEPQRASWRRKKVKLGTRIQL